MDPIATRSKVGNSEVITCQVSKLKDTIDVPLSEFTEELQVVKLDNRDEALVKDNHTIITDNYILVRNSKQNPFKLFDKEGNFITTIGSYGQGPNEYLNVYDDVLDEKSKRIYILPWQSKKVLVFDLTGKAREPIPLPYRVPKGKIFIDSEKSALSVAVLPFNNLPLAAWTQDFKGTLIDSIKGRHLSIKPDFSNEVQSHKNTAAFDYSVFTFYELRPDTVYHYDYKTHRLNPQFTLDFGKKPIKIHWYEEMPNHFIGNVTIEVKLSENLSTTEKPAKFIVNKKNLRGGFYRLHNDFLGNIPIEWTNFNNGYYVWNVEPGILQRQLEKILAGDLVSEKQRQKLTKLMESINDNDNNYVVYAKLKGKE